MLRKGRILVNNTKKGLGKGLGALIPQLEQAPASGVLEISIQEIIPNKNQPRKEFDEEKLQELSQSISQHGVIQPIIVSKAQNGYEIIAGERRWRAAMKAGIKKIPVILKELSDEEKMEIALIENLQREDLNDLEEAQAYKEIMEKYELTQSQLGERLGKSRVAIANTLRLLQLPQKIQDMLKENALTAGHGRAILSVPENFREELARKIAEDNLSVREAEKIAQSIKEKEGSKGDENQEEVKSEESDQDYILDLQERVQRHIGAKVKIKYKNSKGKIEIDYYSDDDLERIIRQLIE